MSFASALPDPDPGLIRPVLADGPETAAWILDYLLDHPDEHDQSNWASCRTPELCGTTRCVGGWANWLHGENDVENGPAAAKHLGLSDSLASVETDSPAHRLFYETYNHEAIRALRFLARGEAIDWAAVKALP